MNSDNERYLKVAEMGVEPGESEKTLRVTELPKEKTEQERRDERVEDNLTALLTHGFASQNAAEAVRNALYLGKAVNAIQRDYGIYNGWEDIAFFLAGKLNASEKERF